jgi:tetratricopeptide (TPR) repeat protein
MPFPLEQTPDSPWKSLARAVMAAQQGQWAEAETGYRRALEQMPYMQMACYGLAEVEAMQKRTDAALEQVRECNRIYPEPEKKKGFEEFVAGLEAAGRNN